MLVAFWTDAHLGIRRASHTTVASQDLLRKFLYEEIMEMLDRIDAKALEMDEHIPTYMLGDLVDLFTNKEEIIDQAITVAKRCDATLAGNHDLRNNSEIMSTLQLIKKQIEQSEHENISRIIISPKPGEGYYHQQWLDQENNVDITFIPHCYTQEAFEASIRGAEEARDPDAFSILCLHCNVGEVHGEAESDSSTLVLTAELQNVVKDFSLVLVGHEHMPKRTKNIQILGNFFPVSFGEIGDRFLWWFDTEKKTLTKELISDKDDQYVAIPVQDMIECGGEMSVFQRMVEVTGEIDVKEYPELNRALLKFWKENGDVLFAVRNSVQVHRPQEAKKRTSTDKQTLPEFVKAAAKTAGFETEFDELNAVVENEDE
jgi:DNA repair exonuclease SbcCD nuclease subunit